jgi:hypothetical protein
MTPAQKRLLFPLRAPRWQTQAWLPWHVAAVAVESWIDGFVSVLTPPGNPRPEKPGVPDPEDRP